MVMLRHNRKSHSLTINSLIDDEDVCRRLHSSTQKLVNQITSGQRWTPFMKHVFVLKLFGLYFVIYIFLIESVSI